MAAADNTLSPGLWSQHRLVTGAPVAADASVAAAFPALATARGFVSTMGYATLKAAVVLAGGTAPTAKIRPVGVDGSSYVWLAAESSSLLTNESTGMIDVFGQLVGFVITDVTGSPTSVEIRVTGGRQTTGAQ
jgi:hypothetical protein